MKIEPLLRRSAFASLLLFAGLQAALAQPRESVYVGVRVCTECHRGPNAGHTFSKWRLTPHAKAYATLAKPVSEDIARLSGIPEAPYESRVCLGCHATAANAEDWERDDTFLIEDGIQCETCHGPGSEYIDPDVMADPELAMERGLRKPTRRTCMVCHGPKGSHDTFLDSWPYDVDVALGRIAHPKATGALPSPTLREPMRGHGEGDSEHDFVGVMACATCHASADMGYQYSRWRMGPHAGAYARLATPEGYEMARAAGIEGDPQDALECLTCHATGAGVDPRHFAPAFTLHDGVQCESCHGAGGDYANETAMADASTAHGAGLLRPDAATCARCHNDAHGRPFDAKAALAAIRHPKEGMASTREPEPEYKTPVNLRLTPDGRELWVACEASASTIVIDVEKGEKVAEIAIGRQPHDVTFSPDGRRALITNRLDDSFSVVDTASREVVRTVDVGDDPHGLLFDRDASRLYVLNSSQGSISVLDGETYEEEKRLEASRVPWSLSLSPDGSRIFVTNTLSRLVPARTNLMSEVTVIDTERAVVDDRVVLPSTNLLQGVAWHPSGDFAVVTLNRTKNLVPMTRLLQGWTITNGIGIVWRDGRTDQVLLDEPDLSFPDAADLDITPEGRYALVTSSGSDRVAVVDLARLVELLEAASPEEREKVFPNHLGKPTEFVTTFLPVGTSPRGITIAADGKRAYTANALSDTVSVLDLENLETIAEIDLGGPEEISMIRWGEQLFHSADIAFRRQFSCHTCHPDGHVDGITYDIEPDGIGVDPVDNRTLRGIFDTAPFKWSGLNKTLQRQCGPRLAVFFTRIEPFEPDELAALERYITTIPRPPNRHRELGAALTPAQRAGKRIFERTHTSSGKLIPENGRCINCHPPPLFTDRQIHNVGNKFSLDTKGEFDTPHLSNIYDSAPYLHNGMAQTLEEIWTVYNPYDQHGVTNDLTKDQLNQLIEYLKTL